jgi:hypothetical protein
MDQATMEHVRSDFMHTAANAGGAPAPAVVTPPPSAVAIQPSAEDAAILAMIERAAKDPEVDIEKMERMWALRESMLDRRAKQAFVTAFALMQPELPIPEEHGEIKNNSDQVQSTYAYWEDIIEVVRPVLMKHGFALSFTTATSPTHVTVTAKLSHQGGHTEETTMVLPHDNSGKKNAVQQIGSSISYGKRYTASALLNLATRGEDDDGQGGPDADPKGVKGIVAKACADIKLCSTDAELKDWKARNEPLFKDLHADDHNAIVRTFNARRRAVLEGQA